MCFFFFIHSFACITAGRCSSAGLLPRKITREDWNGSFTVRSASKQCELVPTRDFWIELFKIQIQNACWAVPNPLSFCIVRCRLRVCSKRFYNKTKRQTGVLLQGRTLVCCRLSGLCFQCCSLPLCSPTTLLDRESSYSTIKVTKKDAGKGNCI